MHGAYNSSAMLREMQKSTEIMGFEPMVYGRVYFDLANQCLRPLSHISKLRFLQQKLYSFIEKIHPLRLQRNRNAEAKKHVLLIFKHTFL